MRACTLALVLLAIGGCAPRHPGPVLQTEDACARQADAREAEQDRGRFIADDQSMSPESAGGLPDDPSEGLGALYSRDQAMSDCITKRTSSTLGGTTIGPNGRE